MSASEQGERMTERVMTDANGRKYITTEQFKPDWDAMAVMVEEQQRMAKRIEDLEALLERQTARSDDMDGGGYGSVDIAEILSAEVLRLQAALAQPEQQAEPVAWMSSDRAWMWSDYNKALAAVVHIPRLTLIPLYAAPPKRPWVGLTPEEVLDLFDINNVYGSKWVEFARTVENKLKEKNA